jgi:hypothetical protein
MAADVECREVELCGVIVDLINDEVATYDGAVSAATNASPIEITTSTAHGFYSGVSVTISNVLGNTAANGSWTIAVVSTTKFTLTGSTGNGAYTSGGTWTGSRFTAQQAFSTDYKLSLLNLLKVDVRIVPETDMEAGDRQPNEDSAQEYFRYEVSVQKAIGVAEVSSINVLINLVKRISRLLYVNYEFENQDAVIVENDTEIYDQVCLRDFGHFHSRINLKVRDYSR